MRQRTEGKAVRMRILLWPGPRRAVPASPPIPTGVARGKRLPATTLTAADLIAMARAARAASNVAAGRDNQQPAASKP
ncbi:hypothetical protein HCU64_07260 [Methylobacterium sp. C25]|uniref:hypothetical protein n=1 Tax=Methylobacterium sp. C25 TaxID=2721622 RepID=UPI001F451DB2|nr:hypothetical protein [Methylobacterium sp. C25]MCE4223544.1 hypothetical protein [Methylobacterium sp. C25]